MKHYLIHSGCAQFCLCGRLSTFFHLNVTEIKENVTCEECKAELKTWKLAAKKEESPKTLEEINKLTEA